ncbi:2,3-bisphosphoglycerate-independent phosphoglycerate mutase [Oceanicola sp. D3]|uniref:2,3-bisphosphoglycerate-independent phosphoglycerate mutase n=1 Tax=Oceanicola sp. D3 TaxID=2587163 RepID=UPI00111FDE67|nr:2,3-bisphosphoglycerate-independent phosphoglycerate mutase [Oceanicola sp. D3]QDC08334.1 2,3-bisphosphoglycerate-independent phosphoglycerate mutase [Oceanicola sp. D3]
MPKPVVLCILDGWGIGDGGPGDAPALAKTPNFDRLMETCPNASLTTFGPDVGLPSGQMGNSEVGHTNIGAGRVVAMDLGQIDLAIEDDSFAQNEGLGAFIAALKASGGTAHLAGLVSPGGVHSHQSHMIAAAKAIAAAGVPVAIHALTDGRDVAPKSADGYIGETEKHLPDGAKFVTVSGRYYAMDRDNRWDRVSKAYEAIVQGKGEQGEDAVAVVQAAYEADKTDEFILPTVLSDYAGMKDGDGLFFLNFRADRAREILRAIGEPGFAEFDTGTRPELAALLGMVEYSEGHNAYMTTCFPPRDIVNTLGAWVAEQGLTQFHIAETEKYPHVTFFLNGGKEDPEPGEDRYMPRSPNVATYDMQPEMSAGEVTEHLVGAIEKGYDFIVVNFANPDMVGHTGIIEAAVAACEAVDAGLGAALEALKKAGGAMIVTADHGNCDMMIDPETGGPHTAHTLNPVPVVVYGAPEGTTVADGRLADLAPTVLSLMGLPQPEEMTGKSLLG